MQRKRSVEDTDLKHRFQRGKELLEKRIRSKERTIDVSGVVTEVMRGVELRERRTYLRGALTRKLTGFVKRERSKDKLAKYGTAV